MKKYRNSQMIKIVIIGLLLLCIGGIVFLNVNHSPAYKPDLSNFKTDEREDDSAGTVSITKTEALHYTVDLNGEEDVVFKIQSGSGVRSYFAVKVNGEKYDKFSATIYQGGTEKEITLDGNNLEQIDLRIGYYLNHRFFINDMELPDEEEDYTSDAVDLIINFE